MEEKEKLSYLNQTLLDAGVISVMRCPSGFFINWTTIIGMMLLTLTIAGLWWFTYNTADDAGYQRGLAESDRKELRERLDQMAARLSENERLLKLAVDMETK